MINSNGIIQNNKTASDFIRKQRKQNSELDILSKEAEREFIEKNARLILKDGKISYNDKYECDFEWIGSEDDTRKALALHNLKAVTNIAKKYCQDTRDYDNMYAKGLYGLTRASNLFHPFKLIVKNGEIQYDADGNPTFVKFITCAQRWIFKYVVDEFYQKSIHVDNNSTSLNELARMHSGTSKNMTLENYLSTMLAPEVAPPKSIVDNMASAETTSLYDSIHEYINTSSEISSLEKDILEEAFYHGTTSLKKLSTIFKMPQQKILKNQASALGKLKDFLHLEYGINSLNDIM